jgi:hypothetical protein
MRWAPHSMVNLWTIIVSHVHAADEAHAMND